MVGKKGIKVAILNAIIEVLPEEEFFARDLIDPLEDLLGVKLSSRRIAAHLHELKTIGIIEYRNEPPWKPHRIYRKL